MKTPVIALELVRSPAEIERMFGPLGSPERAAWSDGMRRANLLDYGLLAFYGSFLWAVARRFASGGTRAARAAEGLAVLAPVCDALENREILTIIGNLGGSYEAALHRLEVFTWVKWIALGAYFVVLARPLLRAGFAFRIAAIAGSLAFLASLVAVFLRGAFAEVMAFSVSFAILALVIGCQLAREPTA